MEKDDEFLHTYFNHISQLAFDKAKEHLVKNSNLTFVMLILILTQMLLGKR